MLFTIKYFLKHLYQILYSYNINQKISEFLNIKKKAVEFKEIMIVNDKIFIFLKNSYLLIFNVLIIAEVIYIENIDGF